MRKIDKIDSKESQSLQATFNVLIENELNAIGKLPPNLADRAMGLLEKSLEHKKQTDQSIIELERLNLCIEETNTRKYHFWSGLGVVCYFVLNALVFSGAVFLAYFDKTTESIMALAFVFVNFAPKVLKEWKKYKGR